MASPAFEYPEHSAAFTLEARRSEAPDRRRKRLGFMQRSRANLVMPDSAIVCDCRADAAGNIAHVLHNKIGPALVGIRALGLANREGDLHFIVSPSTKDFEVDLFRAMGFEKVHITDGSVEGSCLSMDPWKFRLRAVVAPYLRRRAIEVGVLRDRMPESPPLFIKRTRRTATNMEEVVRIASEFEYEDVFLESLPMTMQIQRVATARHVFAFHGAALSFLYFRDPSQHGCVVEAFSCGFATNWARANAHAVGDGWIGLQGELVGNVIDRLSQNCHHHEFESRNFHLDRTSVQAALSLAASEANSSRDFNSPTLPTVRALRDRTRPQ